LAVSHICATLIFVVPKIETYKTNPDLISQASSKKIRAIIPVYLYGQACLIDEVMKIAKTHNLFVIENNIQMHLSSYNGKITGSFGDVNGTSFYSGKNLGAFGDEITSNNEELGQKINRGLMDRKEGYGARAMSHDLYEINTSDFNVLEDIYC
jgi:dTDP-4-amino-4,6-dideoxygalactose transaminase